MAAPKGNAYSKGRPKGSSNKATIQLKEAILQALEDVGGTDYLAKIARDNPSAFVQLIAKVLPLQAPTQPMEISKTITIIRAKKPDADSTD